MAEGTLSERLVVEIAADTAPLTRGLADASRNLAGFANAAVPQAARNISGAFEGAFGALERSIVRAVKTGELSVRAMVQAMLADLSRLAVNRFVAAPLDTLFRGLAGSILGGVFGSGRATGGPVMANAPYVVGERGPELFVPSSGGEIVAAMPRARPQIVVNVTAQDARSFLRSESRVAAMMARALARGQRNL